MFLFDSSTAGLTAHSPMQTEHKHTFMVTAQSPHIHICELFALLSLMLSFPFCFYRRPKVISPGKDFSNLQQYMF